MQQECSHIMQESCIKGYHSTLTQGAGGDGKLQASRGSAKELRQNCMPQSNVGSQLNRTKCPFMIDDSLSLAHREREREGGEGMDSDCVLYLLCY